VIGQAPLASPQAPQQSPVTIDAVVALMRDDLMRSYKIDVETDSLIEADQNEQKQRSTELLTAVGEFFAKLGPIMKEMPPLAPMFGALLQDCVRKYRVPSSLEEMIEKTMEKAGMLLMNPPPPQASPDEQIKLKGTMVKTQAEIQKAQIGAQQAEIEGQTKIAALQLDHQTKQAEHGMKMQQMQADQHMAQQEFTQQQAAQAMQAQGMDRQDQLAQAQHERAMQAAKAKGQP
jgi:hypothetical protein